MERNRTDAERRRTEGFYRTLGAKCGETKKNGRRTEGNGMGFTMVLAQSVGKWSRTEAERSKKRSRDEAWIARKGSHVPFPCVAQTSELFT